jgi:small subunit ribosomal protein S2
MAPYIYGERNKIHIIDILQTTVCLEKACKFLFKAGKNNKTILFVGTKRQASKNIKLSALKCKAHYVNQRWLGGMLTNWSTMRTCVSKLRQLEQEDFNSVPKKEAALLKKQKEKLEKYFGGVKDMYSIPDIVVLVGQPRETNAIKECLKLNIPTITLLDTNCNPDLAYIGIPANDDSIRSIQLILGELTKAFIKGKKKAKTVPTKSVKKNIFTRPKPKVR